ncbi:hypothetical protein F0U60_11100 [Archangium minus]|uniref:Uncharacterized protein n=1 Tax=Archangium minus TaxID=83450 RepID=A0ABY9WL72_9BACT|nr:hypothetical protein F0U60_11100 [Archangium minus]
MARRTLGDETEFGDALNRGTSWPLTEETPVVQPKNTNTSNRAAPHRTAWDMKGLPTAVRTGTSRSAHPLKRGVRTQ